MSFDCVVIGGGAAGMMAAIQCKENNMQTVIIEHTAKLGTKILKTGNGKCNFSNTFMTKEMYQNNNADYAMRIINRFNVDDTIHFFENLSVYKKERNGYLYPRSEMAASVALGVLQERYRHLIFRFFLRHLLKKLTGQATNMCYSLKERRLIQLRLRQ